MKGLEAILGCVGQKQENIQSKKNIEIVEESLWFCGCTEIERREQGCFQREDFSGKTWCKFFVISGFISCNLWVLSFVFLCWGLFLSEEEGVIFYSG